MKENGRYYYLDSIGGLLILHMIAFHIFRGDVAGTLAEECMRPLSFFMFWFFYKSGMFYKPLSCNDILRKGWYKLIIPYAFFSLAGFVVWCLRQTVVSGFDILDFLKEAIQEFAFSSTIPNNVALWFLPSLLFVHIVFNIFYKIGGGSVGFIILGCIGFAYFFHFIGAILPLYIINFPLGVASYSLGYIMKERQYDNVVFVMAMILYVGIFVLCPSSLSFRENHLIGDNGYYLLAIIFSFAGCIVINNIFKKYLPHRCPVLHWIGCRSMDFYVPHMIILTLCLFVPKIFVPYLKELQCLSCIILLPIFSIVIERLGMGWIFGKRTNMF